MCLIALQSISTAPTSEAERACPSVLSHDSNMAVEGPRKSSEKQLHCLQVSARRAGMVAAASALTLLSLAGVSASVWPGSSQGEESVSRAAVQASACFTSRCILEVSFTKPVSTCPDSHSWSSTCRGAGAVAAALPEPGACRRAPDGGMRSHIRQHERWTGGLRQSYTIADHALQMVQACRLSLETEAVIACHSPLR